MLQRRIDHKAIIAPPLNSSSNSNFPVRIWKRGEIVTGDFSQTPTTDSQ
jgi:hypothetical protein